MAIASFDIEMQAILRFGFDHIVAHPEVLDDIFSNLKEGHLWKLYGDKEIAKIKQWVSENNIPVLTAWSMNPTKIPGVSIHIASSSEDAEHAFFGDHGGIEEVPHEAREIIPSFVPDSYSNGVIVVPGTVDLTLARPAHIIIDGKGEEYVITEIVANNITIDTSGDPFDKKKARIVSFIKSSRVKAGQIYVQEAVDIGIHGHAEQNTVLWLYYMIIWIFARFKPEIEKRCMDLTTWSASDFKRDSQYLGENIFTRWMRIQARTRISWLEDPYPEIDTVVADVHVDEE